VGEPYRGSFPLLAALTAPTLIALPQATASALLFGVSRHRGVVTLSIANALLNLGLSILWVRPYGLMGVALGTAIPLALVSGLGMMVYVCRALAIPFGTYLWHGMLRPGLVCAAFAAPALLLRWRFDLTGWGPLAAATAGCWLVFAACAWAFGVAPAERERWARAIAGLFGRGTPAAGAEGA
jgi:peptidoglycan biosynthesis protein MviN/MurJ (putative lipid II flippase)